MVAKGQPEYGIDPGLIGWIHKTAHQQHWRVASWYQVEDLIQDGFLWWCIARDRYGTPCGDQPAKAKNINHLMALFKTCYINHIHDLANKRTRGSEVPVSQLGSTSDSFWEDVLGAEDEIASALVLISQAPEELKDVFNLLVDDVGLAKLREPFRVVDGVRETTNDRLCRFTGRDPKCVDLAGAVKEFLAPA